MTANYQNDYEYFYTKYYSRIELTIKEYLIQSKIDKITFGLACVNINNYLNTTLPQKRREVVNFKELKRLFELFNGRYSDYEDDQINLIFSKQIVPLYGELQPFEKPENYNISKLLQNFAFLNAIKEISRLFHNHNQLFEMHYKLNNFCGFVIREYRNVSIENTDIYISLAKELYPDNYIQDETKTDFFEEIENYNPKTISLPFSIAMLNEIGFFELESIKRLTPINQAKIIAIIQTKNPNDLNINRAISGNVRVLNPDNKENEFKYTSYKHSQKVKEVLNLIKQGNH